MNDIEIEVTITIKDKDVHNCISNKYTCPDVRETREQCYDYILKQQSQILERYLVYRGL